MASDVQVVTSSAPEKAPEWPTALLGVLLGKSAMPLIASFGPPGAPGSSANLYWALARPSPITSPRRVAEAAAAEEAVTFRVQTAFLPLGDTAPIFTCLFKVTVLSTVATPVLELFQVSVEASHILGFTGGKLKVCWPRTRSFCWRTGPLVIFTGYRHNAWALRSRCCGNHRRAPTVAGCCRGHAGVGAAPGDGRAGGVHLGLQHSGLAHLQIGLGIVQP